MDAAEQILAKGQEIVKIAQGLSKYVVGAAKDGTAAHVVEQNTMQIVLNMGNAAMKLLFSLQGTGDLGPSVTLPDGRVVKRLETLHTRDYLSIFGPITLERAVYGSREGQKIDFIPRKRSRTGFSLLIKDWAERESGNPWMREGESRITADRPLRCVWNQTGARLPRKHARTASSMYSKTERPCWVHVAMAVHIRSHQICPARLRVPCVNRR